MEQWITAIVVNLLLFIYGKRIINNKNKRVKDTDGFFIVKNSNIDLILGVLLLITSLILIVFIVTIIPKHHWFIVLAIFIALITGFTGSMLIYLYRTAKLKYNKELIIKNNETFSTKQIIKITKIKRYFIPMFEVFFDKNESIIINSLSQGSMPFIKFIKEENRL